MTTLIASQKIFTKSLMVPKPSPSKLIDRANYMMFLAGCLWVAVIIPQTPPIMKVTLGIASVVSMRKSGKYIDKAKDNPQRRIFETAMKEKNY